MRLNKSSGILRTIFESVDSTFRPLMTKPDAANSDVDSQEAGNLRLKVRLLLLIPWPMLYFGYWSLYHVKGPASDGFGMGMYAAGIDSTAYGITLYALNRAIVYSRQIAKARSGDRALYGVALVLFVVGILGLIPMLFLLMLGFPFSLVGIILTVIALFRWRVPTGKTESSRVGT